MSFITDEELNDLTTRAQEPQESQPTPLDMEILRQYVAAIKTKKNLDADLKTIKARIDELEPVVTGMLMAQGVPSITVDSQLIYLQNEVFVGAADDYTKDDLIAAIKADDDVSVFVTETYNTNSLKAWVREIADNVMETCKANGELFEVSKVTEALPKGLQQVLKVSIGKSVRTRAAVKK